MGFWRWEQRKSRHPRQRKVDIPAKLGSEKNFIDPEPFAESKKKTFPPQVDKWFEAQHTRRWQGQQDLK